MKHLNLFNSNSEYELHKNSSQYVTPEVSFIEETSTVFYVPKQELYEFVDLGLPSGTKWASTNIGAEKPEDFGLYFQWGETEGYSGITENKEFNWNYYKWCNGSSTTLTKYNNKSSYGDVDNLTTLEQVDDAAYQSDNTCRIPTKADLEELIANTTSTWETLNDINGRRFISKTNGNSIFIPAAGLCSNTLVHNVGQAGVYWSSSLNETNPYAGWNFDLYPDSIRMTYNPRCAGFPIRPVKSK